MATLKQLIKQKAKLKANIKQADRFLKEVRKAKKDGTEKAKMGTKTYTITALISKGIKIKKTAINRLKRTEKAILKKKATKKGK